MSRYDVFRLSFQFLAKRLKKVTLVPSRAQKIDWAFGSAVIENPKVTREMVERAVDTVEHEATA